MSDAIYEPDEPEPDLDTTINSSAIDGAPVPIVWDELGSEDAEQVWLTLNAFVNKRLRHDLCLPATIVPAYWHRFPLLVEQLTALWMHYEGAYNGEQHASAQFGWLRDLEEWKGRMREAVAMLGCRNDAVRPYRVPLWPGEAEPEPDPDEPEPPPVDTRSRDEDFVAWVMWDVARRRVIENRRRALILAASGQSRFFGDDEDEDS